MPDATIIGQDEDTEIHVQALVQSGRRHVDIRVWRRGPSGFAPSRSGLTLGPTDLDALQEGVADLLRASSGGTQVARVVWDDTEGRRLRAEIAPFGTRHIARLGFWQRVRSTWRAADDGLVITADRLPALQHTLNRFRPWFAATGSMEERQQAVERTRETLGRWPSPGGDWLTIEGDRAAFHPRGIRITTSLVETGGEHGVRLVQWRREESLWLPQEETLHLTATTIEALLAALETLENARFRGEMAQQDIVVGEETVRLRLAAGGTLAVEHGAGLTPVLAFPADHLLRFGRFLLQSWSFLLERLTEEEWAALEAAPFVLVEHLHDAGASRETPDRIVDMSEESKPELSRGELLAETKITVTPEQVECEVQEAVADLPEPIVEDTEPVEHPLDRRQTPRRLGETMVDEQRITFSLLDVEEPLFLMLWGDRCLAVRVDLTEELVSGLRTLYYDSLLGRRHTLTLEEARMRAGIHNQGMRVCLLLEGECEGEPTSLSIPGVEVPAFLNAIEAALAPH